MSQQVAPKKPGSIFFKFLSLMMNHLELKIALGPKKSVEEVAVEAEVKIDEDWTDFDNDVHFLDITSKKKALSLWVRQYIL